MSASLEISQLRQEYSKHELDESMVHSQPVEQFKIWFNEALDSQVLEPNAFTLSTIGEDDFPTSRVLLLKEINENGFVFYTNYRSAKGREIEKNPRGAMTFLWLELQRQVRIKGTIQKVPGETSRQYFQSRPFESQLGAWVSPQSEIINSRAYLDNQLDLLRKEFIGKDILPLPEHWGGYILKPVEIEFWQGRMGRLHDRIRYRTKGQDWLIERLAP